MADIVTMFAASHAPMMTAARDDAPRHQADAFLGALADVSATLRDRGAQAVVICSNEHFTNFFLENFPQTCIGVGERHVGPVEHWLRIDRGWVPGASALGEHIARQVIAQDHEPSFSHDLRLDHGVMTIYHAIDPTMRLPLVPVIQNCAVKPMASLRRCYDFGRALRRAVESFDGLESVAIVGAGGLSHWVGEPRVGDIDEEFDRWFLERLASGELEDVLSLSDEELEQAGNGAHEIRSWLTIAGAAAPATATVRAYEPIAPWITGMGVAQFM